MGVAMGAGYPLTQGSWGYNNYSSYLGYNTGVGGAPPGLGSPYQSSPLSSYGSSVLDPLLAVAGGGAPLSPQGNTLCPLSPQGNILCPLSSFFVPPVLFSVAFYT